MLVCGVCVHSQTWDDCCTQTIHLHPCNKYQHWKKVPRNCIKDNKNLGVQRREPKKFIRTDACVYGYCAATMDPFGLILGFYLSSAWYGNFFTHQACLRCTTTLRNINSKVECQVFYHCFPSSTSACTLNVSICRVKFFLSIYV